MYTHLIKVVKTSATTGFIVVQEFRTTEDAIGIRLQSLARQLALGMILGFTATRLDSAVTYVRKGAV